MGMGMSGSRTSWVVAGIIGGAVVVMIGMAGVLAAAFFWFAPQSRVVSERSAPERIEEPVAVEAPVTEPDPEPEPEPEPEPRPGARGRTGGRARAGAGWEAEAVVTSECVPNSKGITQLGPKKWRVKRSLIEKYTSSSSAASKLARVKWAKTSRGRTGACGSRVFRARARSRRRLSVQRRHSRSRWQERDQLRPGLADLGLDSSQGLVHREDQAWQRHADLGPAW